MHYLKIKFWSLVTYSLSIFNNVLTDRMILKLT